MGMGDKIGSIEGGKRADLILIDLHTSHFTPAILNDRTNLIQQLVSMGDPSDVVTVIIEGKTIMENRIIKTVNEEQVIGDMNKTAFDLIKRSSLYKSEPIF